MKKVEAAKVISEHLRSIMKQELFGKHDKKDGQDTRTSSQSSIDSKTEKGSKAMKKAGEDS